VTQASGVSRRELLTRATALVAGATVLDRLPHALRLQGWLEDAYAAGPNVVAQTLNGLVAFIRPRSILARAGNEVEDARRDRVRDHCGADPHARSFPARAFAAVGDGGDDLERVRGPGGSGLA
jgi:hypothetical protein